MPLIKARPNRVPMVRHISRLQVPVRDVLVEYAKFIGDTPDWVLNQLIDSTLAKDRDFVTWREKQGSQLQSAPPPHPRRDSVTRDGETT
jgi:hypothetical protein